MAREKQKLVHWRIKDAGSQAGQGVATAGEFKEPTQRKRHQTCTKKRRTISIKSRRYIDIYRGGGKREGTCGRPRTWNNEKEGNKRESIATKPGARKGPSAAIGTKYPQRLFQGKNVKKKRRLLTNASSHRWEGNGSGALV